MKLIAFSLDTNQPYQIILGRTDKRINAAALFFIIAMWGIAFYAYVVLPPLIPVHFDFHGNINGYGGKATLLILPVISTLIFIGISLLNRHPHIFNYPVTITEENRAYQYNTATRMMRWLKLIIAFIFCLVIVDIYVSATKKADSASFEWILISIIVLINMPTIYFIRKMVKGKVSAESF